MVRIACRKVAAGKSRTTKPMAYETEMQSPECVALKELRGACASNLDASFVRRLTTTTQLW